VKPLSPKALSVCSGIVMLMVLSSVTCTHGQNIQWRDALKQKPEWYETDQAIKIADKLLLYQRNTGGWPKNIDMASALSKAEESKLLQQKTDRDSTIDNSATYTQLIFLARVFIARKDERHRAAFLVVKDPGAGPVWARFYEVSTNRPIFLGRDGVVKYDVAQIEEVRRTGYAWYVDSPLELLSKDYPEWLSKNGLH
jgi:Pectic acid lyase